MLFPLFFTPQKEELVTKPESTPGREPSRSLRNNWIAPVVKLSPTPSKSVSSDQFEPSFEPLSARQRKLRDMRGNHFSEKNFHTDDQCVPRNLKTLGRYLDDDDQPVSSTPSNPRRVQSPLIPASMLWSTELVSNAPLTDPTSRRRAATDLMATTMPWTTPMTPSSDQSKPPVHVRRQATDLIPQTMPWVTRVKSTQPIFETDQNKYRRRRIVDNQPETAPTIFSDHSSVCHTFSFPSVSSSVLTLSESQLRSLLTSQGLHIVSVKFNRDLLTGDKKGSVEIVVRFREDKRQEVEERLRDLVTSTTRGG